MQTYGMLLETLPAVICGVLLSEQLLIKFIPSTYNSSSEIKQMSFPELLRMAVLL
jgi:hypothetical protein